MILDLNGIPQAKMVSILDLSMGPKTSP
jgi:hypothetical protein